MALEFLVSICSGSKDVGNYLCLRLCLLQKLSLFYPGRWTPLSGLIEEFLLLQRCGSLLFYERMDAWEGARVECSASVIFKISRFLHNLLYGMHKADLRKESAC